MEIRPFSVSGNEIRDKRQTIIEHEKEMELNETCCVQNGVPEQCMGLCRSHRNRRSVLNGFPLHGCDEHLPKIHSCLFKGIMILHTNNSIS